MTAGLSLRLDDVPGLDPIGLIVGPVGLQWPVPSICYSSVEAMHFHDRQREGQVWLVTPVPGDDEHVRHTMLLRPDAEIRVSDPATRDRCARWLAERVGLEVGATAPGPCRYMTVARAGRRTGGKLVLGSLTWCDGADMDAGQGCHPARVVPALASIDLADPHADWRARAAVCRHVGGER